MTHDLKVVGSSTAAANVLCQLPLSAHVKMGGCMEYGPLDALCMAALRDIFYMLRYYQMRAIFINLCSSINIL